MQTSCVSTQKALEMPELSAGLVGTLDLTVAEKNCTVRGDYHIFSTPELVLLAELTAIEALKPYLQDGQSSVGTRVDIAHSAATLLGQTLTSKAVVKEVDRRRVLFEIEVRDEIDEVATGTHERFIVDLDRFGSRLDAKAAAVAALPQRNVA